MKIEESAEFYTTKRYVKLHSTKAKFLWWSYKIQRVAYYNGWRDEGLREKQDMRVIRSSKWSKNGYFEVDLQDKV